MLDTRSNILFWFTPLVKLILCAFLLNSSSSGVMSDILYDVVNEKAWCESICLKQYPFEFNMLLSTARFHDLECCNRGCRYYSIASAHLGGVLKDKGKRADAVKTVCERSCKQAYTPKRSQTICNGGCSLVSERKHNEMIESQLSWAVYVEDGNNVLVIQPVAADFEPDDVLTDPGLRSQLNNAAGDRLPETHIRSIPDLEDELLDVEISNANARSVLDCLSRRVGLSRLSLLFLLTLVLVVAMLAFASSLTDKHARSPRKAPPLLPHPFLAQSFLAPPLDDLPRKTPPLLAPPLDDLPRKTPPLLAPPLDDLPHKTPPLDDLPPKYEACVEQV